MSLVLAGAALALTLGLLAFERLAVCRARRQVGLVIHVNGTRGKSTVTRMIHALLRRAGYAVYGKTSGSAARFLLPDGAERPVPRFAPANVREQRNLLFYAASCFSGIRGDAPRALVCECNAVAPELQKVSAAYLTPDITVITNARADHLAEQGDAAEAAKGYRAAVPPGCAVITPADAEAPPDSPFPDNTACLLALAAHLGLDRALALEVAAGEYDADPGAFITYTWEQGGRQALFADARAANDIESTAILAAPLFDKMPAGVRKVLLVACRDDRPDRTRSFGEYAAQHLGDGDEPHFDTAVFLGHTPLALKYRLRATGAIFMRRAKGLDKALGGISTPLVILAAGNFAGRIGRDVTRWLQKRRAP